MEVIVNTPSSLCIQFHDCLTHTGNTGVKVEMEWLTIKLILKRIKWNWFFLADILVGSKKQHDFALFIFDRNNV